MQKVRSISSPLLAIFGSSFNPPTNGHFLIVKKLTELFDKVVIIPRGTDFNKPSTSLTTPLQRKEMVQLILPEILGVEADFSDLDENVFTPTWMLDKKYKIKFPDFEIWHVIGGDIVRYGKNGNSDIERRWDNGKEIWETLNWAVIDQPSLPVDPADLPPKSMLIKMNAFFGRSTTVRERIASSQPVSDLVPLAIKSYITQKNLYKSKKALNGLFNFQKY